MLDDDHVYLELTTRDEQVESGMAWYRARRKHQQEIQAAILDLKASQDT